MATYRVGDTYLSEEEYVTHRRERIHFLIVLGGAALGFMLVRSEIVSQQLSQGMRFALQMGGMLLGGGVCYLLRHVLRWAIMIMLALWLGSIVVQYFWNIA